MGSVKREGATAEVTVKIEPELARRPLEIPASAALIDLSSSDESDVEEEESVRRKFALEGNRSLMVESEERVKRRKSEFGALIALPVGFLDPLPPLETRPPALLRPPEIPPAVAPVATASPVAAVSPAGSVARSATVCRQFWKAGDYKGSTVELASQSGGMDHVRVHPKFLHSNATSHKWALGAIAELLDNALDEVCNGATYVNIDVMDNTKDFTKMLLVEDNGGGMDPDKLRQCMSLGYSVKSKSANTIGQYGNGFKTSTMRLGADVIVFSRCRGGEGRSPSQSIGMLSYTFLRTTGKEDIVVPMLDYMGEEKNWKKLLRSSEADWSKNLETILCWSPFSTEDDLLHQFDLMADQGTRIVIFNLWEDDQGLLELDFGAEQHDIQIRGVNRDENKIEMARKFPNSRHFLTYRHSLRSYASILYLRLPPGFKMFLRGKEIIHHSIVDDMMFKKEVTYKPQGTGENLARDMNMLAVVTIGFVKDAKDHIDVQGFNVYHKNRLIKPFWRVWNAAGSGGRGVIGVLEANFVEPAHDKQDFERTTVLARLEARLVQMQKVYWGKNSHMIGYNRQKNLHSKNLAIKGSPELSSPSSIDHGKGSNIRSFPPTESTPSNDYTSVYAQCTPIRVERSEEFTGQVNQTQDYAEVAPRDPTQTISSLSTASPSCGTPNPMAIIKSEPMSMEMARCSISELSNQKLHLQIRLRESEERERALAARLKEVEEKLEVATKEQEALIDIFSEEQIRRDKEEERLRKKLKEASNTIKDLLDKITKTGQ